MVNQETDYQDWNQESRMNSKYDLPVLIVKQAKYAHIPVTCSSRGSSNLNAQKTKPKLMEFAINT